MEAIFSTFICSIFAAFYFICNDLFKIRGDVFVFWRSVFLVIFLLPVMPFLNWSYPLRFYMIIAGSGVLFALSDVFTFSATRTYSAAAISRIVVSRNIIMFFAWLFISDGYYERLIAHGYVLWGSMALMFISTWALVKMRHNPVSVKVLMAALPVIIFVTAGDLLFATGISGKLGLKEALLLTVVMGASMTVTAGCGLAFQSIREGQNIFFADNKWPKAGAANGALLICLVITKAISISYLENPGYFGAMVTIYTLWLFLLHKYWLKREDVTDPKLGFVVVLCSIGLGLLSLQIPR